MNVPARSLLLVASLLIASAPALAKSDKRLMAMTPERFLAAASTDDDPLEFETLISTERGHRRDKAAKGTVDSDVYLRAVIDKRSGAARYEVWQDIRYFGPRRAYHAVHFPAAHGVERAPLAIARHGADLCPNAETNGECILTKTIAFPVGEALLRQVAARYASDATNGWQFKLKDQTGRDIRSTIVPAEAAGLLLAVDAYRAGAAATRVSARQSD
jgi:hypothetical protein